MGQECHDDKVLRKTNLRNWKEQREEGRGEGGRGEMNFFAQENSLQNKSNSIPNNTRDQQFSM